MIRRSLLIVAATLLLAACGQGGDKTAGADAPLIVGATAVPHAEILEHIKPLLAAEGVEIEIKVFNDYVQPNTQLAERPLTANGDKLAAEVTTLRLAIVDTELRLSYAREMTKMITPSTGEVTLIPLAEASSSVASARMVKAARPFSSTSCSAARTIRGRDSGGGRV